MQMINAGNLFIAYRSIQSEAAECVEIMASEAELAWAWA